MEKIIITGAPHTGKTTLLDALKAKHPDYIYIPEPATQVIEAEYQQEKAQDGYVGTFPWNNYAGFGPKVIAKSIELEKELLPTSGLAVLDRSLIDTIAYARMNDCEYLLPGLHDKIKAAHYTKAFFCDFVGSYQSDHIRSESFEEAQMTQQALRSAYEESDVQVIEMPAIPVEERILFFEKEVRLS